MQLVGRDGAPILRGSSFESMTSGIASVEMEGVEDASYGLGHGVHKTPAGETVLYHSGSNPGYLAYFIVALESRRGLVIVSNGASAVPIVVTTLNTWSEATGVELPPIY